MPVTSPAERPVMRQIWRHLGFFHWPVDRDVVARLLPPLLQPDTFDGAAYIGIVPFTVPLSRAVPGLRVPIAPPFHELNLRTYVHRGGHAPGVWFFSLDAASLLAVLGARLIYGLPYFHARAALEVTGDPAAPSIDYRSSRRLLTKTTPAAEFQARYSPTDAAAEAKPGTLEFFLVERYRLYAWKGGALTEARVHHAPYPVQRATVVIGAQTLTSAAGLPRPIGPPSHVHYAREVDVRIFRPHVVNA